MAQAVEALPTNITKHIVITLKGVDESDVEFAFEEVVSLIRKGFTSGQNSNETGSFVFDISDQEDSHGKQT